MIEVNKNHAIVINNSYPLKVSLHEPRAFYFSPTDVTALLSM